MIGSLIRGPVCEVVRLGESVDVVRMISYMRLEWYLVVLQQQCRPSDEASEVGVRFSP